MLNIKIYPIPQQSNTHKSTQQVMNFSWSHSGVIMREEYWYNVSVAWLFYQKYILYIKLMRKHIAQRRTKQVVAGKCKQI